jgi:cell division protein FtsZ
MSNMGRALMGTGIAKGASRARMAAEMAVASPLLDEISVDGATGVLINIVGGPDLKMREIQEAASLVQEQAHEDANIIFGASIDETLGENVKVTVIATGFDSVEKMIPIEHARAVSASSMVPQTVPSQAAPQSSYMRPPMRESQVPQVASRRAQHVHEARSHAAPPSQGRLPIQSREERAQPSSRTGMAERAPSSSGFPNDVDWDVPAFQRKQQ